ASAWAVEPLLDLAPMGFKVVGVSHFFEHAIGRVPLRHLTPAWFMSILHLRQKPYTRLAKRSFDLVVASLGLLLIAPLLPMLAAIVRMSRGPIIYSQIRLGEGGRHYRMYKFRTMRADAEEAGRPLFAWARARIVRALAARLAPGLEEQRRHRLGADRQVDHDVPVSQIPEVVRQLLGGALGVVRVSAAKLGPARDARLDQEPARPERDCV